MIHALLAAFGRRKEVAFLTQGTGAGSFYRAVFPADALRARGVPVSVLPTEAAEAAFGFRVVVAENPFGRVDLGVLRRLARRVRLVLSLDHTLDRALDSCGEDSAMERAADLIAASSAILVGSESLARLCERFSSRVFVVPSLIPEGLFAAPPSRGSKLKVGWHGGAWRRRDLELLREVLPEARRRFPDVEFVFLGAPPAFEVPGAVLAASVPFTELPSALRGLAPDIGLAPALGTSTNRCRDGVEWAEMASTGMAVIASPGSPYVSFVSPGVDGLLAADPQDWIEGLGLLIHDAAARKRIAAAGEDSARRRFGEPVARRYLDILSAGL